MSAGRYENFPAGSILLPRRLRKSIHTVYVFARTVDDIVDGGKTADTGRLYDSDDLQKELGRIYTGKIP